MAILTGRPLSRGQEVWLLKRAQILVGDIWGAFQVNCCAHHWTCIPLWSLLPWPSCRPSSKSGCRAHCVPFTMQGQGVGGFHDIGALTMFADYRVPVVLRQMGILKYSQDLAEKARALPLPRFLYPPAAPCLISLQ